MLPVDAVQVGPAVALVGLGRHHPQVDGLGAEFVDCLADGCGDRVPSLGRDRLAGKNGLEDLRLFDADLLLLEGLEDFGALEHDPALVEAAGALAGDVLLGETVAVDQAEAGGFHDRVEEGEAAGRRELGLGDDRLGLLEQLLPGLPLAFLVDAAEPVERHPQRAVERLAAGEESLHGLLALGRVARLAAEGVGDSLVVWVPGAAIADGGLDLLGAEGDEELFSRIVIFDDHAVVASLLRGVRKPRLPVVISRRICLALNASDVWVAKRQIDREDIRPPAVAD